MIIGFQGGAVGQVGNSNIGLHSRVRSRRRRRGGGSGRRRGGVLSRNLSIKSWNEKSEDT